MSAPRSSSRFQRRYGPWALVTGAAQGLGAAFADECARRGLHVILVDRLATEVRDVAARVGRAHGVMTRAVVCDLSGADPWARIGPAIEDLEVGLLVNNAGLGPVARFLELPLADHEAMLGVNCRAPLVLTHHMGKLMAARGRGGVVFVTSLTAFQGTALVASYAGSKAWSLIFGESLAQELAPRGVDVLVVPLGATATPGWEASRPALGALAARGVLSTRVAATSALDALGRRRVAIPGLANRLTALVTARLLPRRAATALLSLAMAHLYPGR